MSAKSASPIERVSVCSVLIRWALCSPTSLWALGVLRERERCAAPHCAACSLRLLRRAQGRWARQMRAERALPKRTTATAKCADSVPLHGSAQTTGAGKTRMGRRLGLAAFLGAEWRFPRRRGAIKAVETGRRPQSLGLFTFGSRFGPLVFFLLIASVRLRNSLSWNFVFCLRVFSACFPFVFDLPRGMSVGIDCEIAYTGLLQRSPSEPLCPISKKENS